MFYKSGARRVTRSSVPSLFTYKIWASFSITLSHSMRDYEHYVLGNYMGDFPFITILMSKNNPLCSEYQPAYSTSSNPIKHLYIVDASPLPDISLSSPSYKSSIYVQGLRQWSFVNAWDECSAQIAGNRSIVRSDVANGKCVVKPRPMKSFLIS